jgi:hypothetical protein
MTKKSPVCADCGERLDPWLLSQMDYFGGLCDQCRKDYDQCVTCRRWVRLADMRQAYCVDCRRTYDRDRWARQRAARGI